MFGEPEAEANPSKFSPRRGLRSLWHRLSVSFVLVIGIIIFLTVVGFDSLQQASAADMPNGTLVPSTAAASPSTEDESVTLSPGHSSPTGTYLEFDSATAERLSHSDMLGAQLTRSRLTTAHLFTGRLP